MGLFRQTIDGNKGYDTSENDWKYAVVILSKKFFLLHWLYINNIIAMQIVKRRIEQIPVGEVDNSKFLFSIQLTRSPANANASGSVIFSLGTVKTPG